MGMMDMIGMMSKAKEMQARMKEIKANLVNITAEGTSGSGLVKAQVNGNKHLLNLDIDASLLKESSKKELQEFVVLAVNKALQNVEEKTQLEFKQKTEGLIPNVPGMDMGSMFGM